MDRRIEIQVECPVHDSFRVRQVAGMFDLPIADRCGQTIVAQLPELDEAWAIGAIVGPSGSGKTTVARRAFGPALYEARPWPADRAVIDCLGDYPIKRITRTLTAVGLSTPHAWVKPYAVLSTGERFRCDLARALSGTEEDAMTRGRDDAGQNSDAGTRGREDAETGIFTASSRPRVPASSSPASSPLVVFDEFTSVVDRTVAKIGAAAVSKAIRTGAIARRFVAVTCHRDVVPWLAPDWVLDMASGRLTRRRVRRRPPIRLRIRRARRTEWEPFKRHHYLSGSLHPGSICFVGLIGGDHPAAFTAVLPFPHPSRPGWREHRTVCLPDFQGVGIGSALSDFVASLFASTGKPYFSTTSHPAMIRHRMRSAQWKMHRAPGMVSRSGPNSRRSTCLADAISRDRVTAGFEYVGAKLTEDARRFGLLETARDAPARANGPHAVAEWSGTPRSAAAASRHAHAREAAAALRGVPLRCAAAWGPFARRKV